MMETPDEDRTLTFEQLHRKYEEKIHHLILRLVCNDADADELTVETFVSAYRAWGSVPEGIRVSTWLHQIAVNRCKYLFRQRDNDCSSMEEKPQGPTVETGSVSVPSRVLKAIDTLAPEFREAARLNFVENKTYEEISQVLGISVPAVKARLHRARVRLATILSEDNGGSFGEEGPPNGIWQ